MPPAPRPRPLPGALEPVRLRLAGFRARHPHAALLLAGAACGSALLVVFSLYPTSRAGFTSRRVLTAAALASLLALPLIFTASRGHGTMTWRHWLRGGALVAGWGLPMIACALFLDRASIGAMLALTMYAGSICAAVAGAVRLGGGRPLFRTAVAACWIALYAGPFYTLPAIEAMSEEDGAGSRLVAFVAATSPVAVAQTAWPAGGEGSAVYDVRTAPILYDQWVGTDQPVSPANWWAASLVWALLAVILWGAPWTLGRWKRVKAARA